MTPQVRVHAFGDDALGDHDAVAIAERIRTGDISPAEAESAAVERIKKVSSLRAVVHESYDAPRRSDDTSAPLYGVPTLIKDNTDVAGWPTNHGSEAFTADPAKKDGKYATQFMSTGVTVLGKTQMPEFGLNATTEFRTGEPVLNPWNTDYSVGASSGGAAALVAAGAVPIAHANDGGGSIRIPAAAAGLIGLKPSRNRQLNGEQTHAMAINLIGEGIVSRSVRDTAVFIDAMERTWRNPRLAPIGRVEGPSSRKLRIGMVLDSVTDAVADAPTRAAVEHTVALLEKQGHSVQTVPVPADDRLADDFLHYWGLLAQMAGGLGKFAFHKSFDKSKLDGLTDGLRHNFKGGGWKSTPGAIRRLKGAARTYAAAFDTVDVIVCPVVANTTPELGVLSPNVPFDQLIERLRNHVAFTPLQNITGTPAISLPMGLSPEGLPIGVQLATAYGDERTLLEVAFGLEEQFSWPRIQD